MTFTVTQRDKFKQMDKKDKQYIVEGTIKGLITFIPGVGGLIGSLLNDALADRKEQRIYEYLQSLKDEINENKEKLNTQFISTIDFLDIFEATTTKITNERSEEKRKAFKNIMLTGILSPHYSYDDIENQIHILEQLNTNHILLLRFFKSPKAFSLSESSQARSGTYKGYFRAIFPNWEYDYIYDHLNDLEGNRLIDNMT